MKSVVHCIIIFSTFFSSHINGQTTTDKIPLPTSSQLRWQKYEQIMFVCLDPCTWQGREYDNHSTPLNQINPTKLNTDQWCEVAKSWGAKLILFVAKHTGGFCWWQTETTNYGIKETPWKNGNGDVLSDLSKSCKKYGLDLGVYIYPGDAQWGAGIGSGGTTQDPSKQEEYNRVFRTQLSEVLTRYGSIREVWFDGNCNIPVSDILEKYASDAVIFQGKSANIRWVGNEDGFAPYPNWYTLSYSDLATGKATALQSAPYEEAYAPVEVDVPLLKKGGHKWFWAPKTEHLLLDVDQLMDIYYKSVGRGAVLLLNSTPDTTGLIPDSHITRYKQFGAEIKRRFEIPLKRNSGNGNEIEIQFVKPQKVNHVITQEKLSTGQRVLSYIIEGYKNGKWMPLTEGRSIGNKKIDYFPLVEIEKIRIRLTKFKATPQILNFAAYFIPSEVVKDAEQEQSWLIGNWQANTYTQDWEEVNLNLTPFVTTIGQYEITFKTLIIDHKQNKPAGLEFSDWKLKMYGRQAQEAIERIDNNTFRLTHSQQTLDEFPIILKIRIRSKPTKSAGDISIKKIKY